METVEVEMIGQAITAQYGTLNTGDILRTNAAFAKHLVEDCSAAKYRGADKSAAPASVNPDDARMEPGVVIQPPAPAKAGGAPKAGKGKPGKAG